jgi:hypothetical protein
MGAPTITQIRDIWVDESKRDVLAQQAIAVSGIVIAGGIGLRYSLMWLQESDMLMDYADECGTDV